MRPFERPRAAGGRVGNHFAHGLHRARRTDAHERAADTHDRASAFHERIATLSEAVGDTERAQRERAAAEKNCRWAADERRAAEQQ